MLLGSTEWVEQHVDELSARRFSTSTPTAIRAASSRVGQPGHGRFVNRVARGITDPMACLAGGASRATGCQRGAADAGARTRRAGQGGVGASSDLPIGAAGSGSDFSAFLDHAGVTALDFGFGGQGEGGGVYHSATTLSSITRALTIQAWSMAGFWPRWRGTRSSGRPTRTCRCRGRRTSRAP